MSSLIEKWLARFKEGRGRNSASFTFNNFLNWIQERGEFKNVEEMLEYQKSAMGDDRYRIVDLAVDYADNRVATKNTS